MNQDLLNELLTYLDLGVIIDREHFQSGQRAVYFGKSTQDEVKVAIKYCLYHEIRVARIQREISILRGIHSNYFPKVHKYIYVTSEEIAKIIDNINPRKEFEKVCRLKAAKIRPFFISIEEFIPNISWSDALDGPQRMHRLVGLLYKSFEALSLLWAAKIVHRDLKPANILIRPDISPVIIDLGIAKSLKEGTRDLTGAGFFSPCTPAYAAPEQLMPDEDVNYKADQFSMGVIAYEALTGEFPYGNVNDIELDGLVTNFQNGNRRDIRELNSEIDEGLARFINKLLQVQPYKRFRHADSILEELGNIRSRLT